MSGIHRTRGGGDGGFTFVEVITVIIILAILSLIAISTFLGQRDKAERSRAVSALRNGETYAVAIRSDEQQFSACVADYEEEAGANAPYRWKQDVTSGSDGADLSQASIDANEISVYGGSGLPCADGGAGGDWVSMAALARDECFYNLLDPGSEQRLRHRAPAQLDPDEPYCEGSELTPSATPGSVTFRGADIEPSGW